MDEYLRIPSSQQEFRLEPIYKSPGDHLFCTENSSIYLGIALVFSVATSSAPTKPGAVRPLEPVVAEFIPLARRALRAAGGFVERGARAIFEVAGWHGDGRERTAGERADQLGGHWEVLTELGYGRERRWIRSTRMKNAWVPEGDRWGWFRVHTGAAGKPAE